MSDLHGIGEIGGVTELCFEVGRKEQSDQGAQVTMNCSCAYLIIGMDIVIKGSASLCADQ